MGACHASGRRPARACMNSQPLGGYIVGSRRPGAVVGKPLGSLSCACLPRLPPHQTIAKTQQALEKELDQIGVRVVRPCSRLLPDASVRLLPDATVGLWPGLVLLAQGRLAQRQLVRVVPALHLAHQASRARGGPHQSASQVCSPRGLPQLCIQGCTHLLQLWAWNCRKVQRHLQHLVGCKGCPHHKGWQGKGLQVRTQARSVRVRGIVPTTGWTGDCKR